MPRLRLHPVILFDQSAEKLGCLVGRMTGWHCNISYITENYQEGSLSSQSLLVQALTITVFAVSWTGQGRPGQPGLRDNKSYIHQDLQGLITDSAAQSWKISKVKYLSLERSLTEKANKGWHLRPESEERPSLLFCLFITDWEHLSSPCSKFPFHSNQHAI